MELKYNLKQVLSPRKYLSKELREMPRLDTRKEMLKNDITKALSSAKTFDDFLSLMNQKDYAVIKARGIAFIDNKSVKIKGSEVGYSLKTIERILSLRPEEKQAMLKQTEGQQLVTQKEEIRAQKAQSTNGQSARENWSKGIGESKELEQQNSHVKEQSEAGKLLDLLLKPEQQIERINPFLLQKKKRKRKHLHL